MGTCNKVLGDTHTCAIASRTWIWKTLRACMGQINSSSVLANCEIAQFQQTTEILQRAGAYFGNHRLEVLQGGHTLCQHLDTKYTTHHDQVQVNL